MSRAARCQRGAASEDRPGDSTARSGRSGPGSACAPVQLFELTRAPALDRDDAPAFRLGLPRDVDAIYVSASDLAVLSEEIDRALSDLSRDALAGSLLGACEMLVDGDGDTEPPPASEIEVIFGELSERCAAIGFDGHGVLVLGKEATGAGAVEVFRARDDHGAEVVTLSDEHPRGDRILSDAVGRLHPPVGADLLAALMRAAYAAGALGAAGLDVEHLRRFLWTACGERPTEREDFYPVGARAASEVGHG